MDGELTQGERITAPKMAGLKMRGLKTAGDKMRFTPEVGLEIKAVLRRGERTKSFILWENEAFPEAKCRIALKNFYS